MKTASPSHLPALDSLRLLAAIWVAMSHGARFPVEAVLDVQTLFGKVVFSLNNGIFNGVAAVMLFFVISGLVIHMPNVQTTGLNITTFYIRRLVRVVIPALVAYALCMVAGADYLEQLSNVLWSIYCELLYYIAYPLIKPAIKRFGVMPLFGGASLVAFGILIYRHPTSFYWQLDIISMALVGLPAWLLGCALAERLSGEPAQTVTRQRIWAWRFLMLALQAILKMPVVHGPVLIGYPESHWVYAIVGCGWLWQEIHYARQHPMPRWLESCGVWTYSLYLVHNPTLQFFRTFKDVNAALLWPVQTVVLVLAAYVFYKLVESPSHQLARQLANRFSVRPR